MMVAIYPDGQYDHASWQNANDRVMYERTFAQGNREQQLVAQAMICANPETPNDEIRAKMTAQPVPEFGMEKNDPTLDDVLSGAAFQTGHLYDQSPTDFSGSNASTEASSVPSLPYW